MSFDVFLREVRLGALLLFTTPPSSSLCSISNPHFVYAAVSQQHDKQPTPVALKFSLFRTKILHCCNTWNMGGVCVVCLRRSSCLHKYEFICHARSAEISPPSKNSSKSWISDLIWLLSQSNRILLKFVIRKKYVSLHSSKLIKIYGHWSKSNNVFEVHIWPDMKPSKVLKSYLWRSILPLYWIFQQFLYWLSDGPYEYRLVLEITPSMILQTFWIELKWKCDLKSQMKIMNGFPQWKVSQIRFYWQFNRSLQETVFDQET